MVAYDIGAKKAVMFVNFILNVLASAAVIALLVYFFCEMLEEKKYGWAVIVLCLLTMVIWKVGVFNG